MTPESRDEIFFGAARPAAEGGHGRAPLAYAIGWFVAVLLVGFGFWLVDFRVDESVQKAVGYPAVVAFVVFLVRSTPSSRLAPDVRARRDARRFYGIAGALTALLMLAAFIAAFQLKTWSDWLIFGVIAMTPVGVGVMLQTRFTIGRY